jgi:hypothetical protein
MRFSLSAVCCKACVLNSDDEDERGTPPQPDVTSAPLGTTVVAANPPASNAVVAAAPSPPSSRSSCSSPTHVLSRDCLAATAAADDDDESATQQPQAIGGTVGAAAGVRSAAGPSIDEAAGGSERPPRPGRARSVPMATAPLRSPAAVAWGASATDFTTPECYYSVPPALTAGLAFRQLVREVVLGEYLGVGFSGSKVFRGFWKGSVVALKLTVSSDTNQQLQPTGPASPPMHEGRC